MHDIKGFHKIGNPGEDIAVTMHVYSPPFSMSSIVNLDLSKQEVTCTFDSEGGIPLLNHLPKGPSITDEVK